MKNCSKRSCGAEIAAVLPEVNGGAETSAVLPEVSGGASLREAFPLPDSILFSEVFARMELESLCTLACVCRSLRSMLSQALSTLISLDLSVSLHSLSPQLYLQLPLTYIWCYWACPIWNQLRIVYWWIMVVICDEIFTTPSLFYYTPLAPEKLS